MIMVRVLLAGLASAFLLFVIALVLGYSANPDRYNLSILIMLCAVPIGLGSAVGLVALVALESRHRK